MKVPDLEVKKTLYVGIGDPTLTLGKGLTQVRGGAYLEGPAVFGAPPPFTVANVAIAKLKNSDVIQPPFIPGAIAGFNHSPYSLAVDGDAVIFNNLTINRQVEVGSNVIAQGEVVARVLGRPHILSVKKDFDIPHPTKDGWRLTHACVEGPEAAVYHRGTLINNNQIHLPEYWTKLVDEDSITVNITPKKHHQNIIVTKIENNIIYLNEKEGLDINCYYHVYAERIDTEKLIVEYEGGIEDYPGDNNQRSIVGWNYDLRD